MEGNLARDLEDRPRVVGLRMRGLVDTGMGHPLAVAMAEIPVVAGRTAFGDLGPAIIQAALRGLVEPIAMEAAASLVLGRELQRPGSSCPGALRGPVEILQALCEIREHPGPVGPDLPAMWSVEPQTSRLFCFPGQVLHWPQQ